MARKENRPNVELQVERSLGEFSFEQSVDDATPWVDKMFLRFVDRVEVWIRPKLSWDERDLFDRRQMAADIVTESTDHLRKNKLEWAICDMISMCSTIANRKIANAHEHSMCKKNSAILKSIDAEASFDPIDRNRENRPDFELEFQESLDHIWNALDEKQKRIAELSQDENQTDKTMAEEISLSPNRPRSGGPTWLQAWLDPCYYSCTCIVSAGQFACLKRRDCRCQLDQAAGQQKCQTDAMAAWVDSDWISDFVGNGACGYVY